MLFLYNCIWKSGELRNNNRHDVKTAMALTRNARSFKDFECKKILKILHCGQDNIIYLLNWPWKPRCRYGRFRSSAIQTFPSFYISNTVAIANVVSFYRHQKLVSLEIPLLQKRRLVQTSSSIRTTKPN